MKSIFVWLIACQLTLALPSQAASPRAAQCDDFDFWVGSWKIQQEILTADGDYLRLPASTQVKQALDGCGLLEEWQGEVQFFWEGMTKPESMSALSVRTLDANSNQWVIHWIDSRGRRFDAPYIGVFSGNTGDFYRDTAGPNGPTKGRIRFVEVDADHVDWSLATSSDNGHSWTTVWRMAMARIRSSSDIN